MELGLGGSEETRRRWCRHMTHRDREKQSVVGMVKGKVWRNQSQHNKESRA